MFLLVKNLASLILLFSFYQVYADEGRFAPSIGVGLNSLNMTVNSDTKYSPTNTNYYFVSLGYQGYSLQAKYPQLDPEESRKARVDSKIQDYQISADIYKNWKAAFYLQDYKGYFVENKLVQFGIKAPDLNFNHIGAQIFYVFNENHSSFLIQDTYWDQSEDSSSWIASIGLDQFTVNGDLIPAELKENKNQILQKMKADSVSFRGGYSRNWVWSHWYLGSALGFGYNLNTIHATYDQNYVPPETNSSKSFFNSLIALSSGYKWTNAKLGVFARAFSWNLAFDNIEISSNTSSSGFYYSMTF